MVTFLTFLGFLVLSFHRSSRRFSRAEGIALLVTYFVFIFLQAPVFSAFASAL